MAFHIWKVLCAGGRMLACKCCDLFEIYAKEGSQR